MAQLGALLQIGKGEGAAADAAEGVTSIQRIIADAIKGSKNFKKLGIDVFSDKSHTKIRSVRELTTGVLEQTGGDLGKIMKVFGARSMHAFSGLANIYTQAGGKVEKGGVGTKALDQEWERFEKATLSATDIETQSKVRLNDVDKQLEEAMKDLNFRIANNLTPAFRDLVGMTSDLIPIFAGMFSAIKDVTGWITDKLGLSKHNLGVEDSQNSQRDSALAVANEGSMTPSQRLFAAKQRFEKAKGELNQTPFSEDLGALLTGTDTPTLRRYREAEKDVQQAAKELQQYEKNTAATEANTKAMNALSDLMRVNIVSGGSTGRAGGAPPRGPDGSSQLPTFWD
jgi:hypothetical protein